MSVCFMTVSGNVRGNDFFTPITVKGESDQKKANCWSECWAQCLKTEIPGLSAVWEHSRHT